MTKTELTLKLSERTKECGLIQAIHELIGPSVNVRLQFSSEMCAMTVDELNFSVRATNALRRAGIFTVGEVLDAISDGRLLGIRNLGRKSLNEIKTRLLSFSFDQLNSAEKQDFFLALASQYNYKK